MTADTALVSVMHANNEVGTMQPVADARRHRPSARRARFTPMPCSRSARFPCRSRRSARICVALVGAQVRRPEGRRRSLDSSRRSARRADDRRAPGADPPGGHRERARRSRDSASAASVAARQARRPWQPWPRGAIGWSARFCARSPARPINGDPSAPRAEHHEHQLRRRRGRVAADRARPRGRRGVDRLGLLVRLARAVPRAARDGPALRRAPATRFGSASGRRPPTPRLTSSSAILPALVARLRQLGRPALARSLIMRVVVAMSGGVDSSVAASLLVEAGHDVVGLSMQLYDQRQGQASIRQLLQPGRSARRAARCRRARHSPLHRQLRGAVSADRRRELRRRVRRRAARPSPASTATRTSSSRPSSTARPDSTPPPSPPGITRGAQFDEDAAAIPAAAQRRPGRRTRRTFSSR